ncbi:F-box domain containing protein [Tanacetum coccineum]
MDRYLKHQSHILSRYHVNVIRLVSRLYRNRCNYVNDPYLMIVHDERVIEEPTPILYHSHLSYDKRTVRSLCFHVIESKHTDRTYVLWPKEGPFLEFLRKKHLSESSYVQFRVHSSCNGLICLLEDKDYVITSLVVVHPLRKECYEVPPLPKRFVDPLFQQSCGLGFDASTNTLKMVCVLTKDYAPPGDHDMVRKNLCTMVHVFGTNSWREIPQVPPYRITDGAVFANGCLHWLVSHIDIKTEDGGRPVIWFDVEKENFGLIDPPNRMCDLWRNYSCINDHLVDLNGEVGFVCVTTMEVWVLKQKEWVAHCRFKKDIVPYGYKRVLGCWNKDGDMLIRNQADGWYKFFVYNLKSGVLHKTNIFGPDDGFPLNIFMHPNKLFSIRGLGSNSFPMKKTDFKESCQRLLARYYYNSDPDSVLSRFVFRRLLRV